MIFLFILGCLVVTYTIAPNIRYVGLEKAIAVGAGLFLAGGLIWLALMTSGCARKPKTEEPEPAHTPWCFRLEGKARDGTDVSADVCLSLREVCAEARRSAKRYGSMAGVRQIGECRWEP